MVLGVITESPSAIASQAAICVVALSNTGNRRILVQVVGGTVCGGASRSRMPHEQAVADILAGQLVHFV